eukprot:CAMPEP_0206221080 /NCGR_PEP_ID=MMETSP0047_2-20121206/5218_1 /ASSEMBLY_ACC=CAM_ASM_000192 /TAXON_ID=195065 /ORGANISM="Chroomonas mesostigmatica_cf, Strain CCMP1168" /LENGTH=68 /DNA_ID=CAMNT_0053643779 /DNA_START=193 /DNA_END=399 /DNA_ORIENTATION=+
MLTWASGEDEVASTGEHKMNKATADNFCKLCLNVESAFGVGGCRSEYYTDTNLAKCGIEVGKGASKLP